MKIPPADAVDKFSMACGRALALLLVVIIALPGFLINIPATLVVKWVSLWEAKKAKQASNVKIAGRDVIASYKILIAVVLIPLVHIWWGLSVAAVYGWTWGLISLTILQPLSSYARLVL
jgi:glycerol-3-phosphate O-acyltransferase/dihydroxyacetone phosphate acyltransferase